MTQLISPDLASALQEQIAHEKYNANIYLYIAGYLKNKGFDNLGKIFEQQHSEETEHSLIVYNLLTDLNTMFTIPEIPPCEQQFNSIVEIANLYVEREIQTTDSLSEIRDLANQEHNYVVEKRMLEMIEKQQNEYEEATGFQDRALIIGDDLRALLLWDAALG